MTAHTSRPTELNVLVIGHNPILRRGVAAYLGLMNLARRVHEAPFDSDLAPIWAEMDWNLIVLDFEGDVDLTRLQWLKRERPAIPVLVLNVGGTSADRAAALAAGASGYLNKNSAAEEWRRAIEIVASGGQYSSGESPIS